jgi:LuxR family transcriptional regulator, transcriptional regulator of spore coat protein
VSGGGLHYQAALPTKRQCDTLQLIADGATNAEAAAVFGCAERAIEQRLAAMRVRIDARNRAHLVALAIRKGYIK